jgi:hypothetical protein
LKTRSANAEFPRAFRNFRTADISELATRSGPETLGGI